MPIIKDRQYFSVLGIQINVGIFWSLNTKYRRKIAFYMIHLFKKILGDLFFHTEEWVSMKFLQIKKTSESFLHLVFHLKLIKMGK